MVRLTFSRASNLSTQVPARIRGTAVEPHEAPLTPNLCHELAQIGG